MSSKHTPMHSITLDAERSALWEDAGPDGDQFRNLVRTEARDLARQTRANVEVYSHDGIVLDAISAGDAE